MTSSVGNSCPNVWVKGDKITIANANYNEETEERDEPNPEWGVSAGYICTDLWWFYAVDGDVYDAHPNKEYTKGNTQLEWEIEVKVTPGRYRMTVHRDVFEDGWLETTFFATIEKI